MGPRRRTSHGLTRTHAGQGDPRIREHGSGEPLLGKLSVRTQVGSALCGRNRLRVIVGMGGAEPLNQERHTSQRPFAKKTDIKRQDCVTFGCTTDTPSAADTFTVQPPPISYPFLSSSLLPPSFLPSFLQSVPFFVLSSSQETSRTRRNNNIQAR